MIVHCKLTSILFKFSSNCCVSAKISIRVKSSCFAVLQYWNSASFLNEQKSLHYNFINIINDYNFNYTEPLKVLEHRLHAHSFICNVHIVFDAVNIHYNFRLYREWNWLVSKTLSKMEHFQNDSVSLAERHGFENGLARNRLACEE